jgi:hypothetical protein
MTPIWGRGWLSRTSAGRMLDRGDSEGWQVWAKIGGDRGAISSASWRAELSYRGDRRAQFRVHRREYLKGFSVEACPSRWAITPHIRGSCTLLTDEEAAALIKELADISGNDRYPFSSRIQTLRAILAKLRPEPAREPRPSPKVYASARRRRG